MLMRRKPLISIKAPVMYRERVPKEGIRSASPEELGYLAGLVDGEGNLDIAGTQPRIRIGMKDLQPVRLAKQYGGNWYPTADKRNGTISYTWYIQSKPLIDEFVEFVMPYSRVKQEEFEQLRKALKILRAKPDGWKNEIKESGKKLRKMHHKNPVVIFRAARKLDEKKPGWREWVPAGTLIETKPLEYDNVR